MTTTWKGITLTDAYHKVHTQSGSKDHGLHVTVGVHSAQGEAVIFTVSEYVPAADLVHGTDVGDYLAQIYAHLKTRAPVGDQLDYSTATDV